MTPETKHVTAAALLLAGMVFSAIYFFSKIFAVLLLSGIFLIAGGALLAASMANAALLLCSLLFAALIGETWALGGARYAERAGIEWPAGYFSWDESLGSIPAPGRHRIRKLSSTGDVIYDVVYSIGDDHFRVTPQSGHKTRSAEFLGCSFMFGEGLNDDQTLPFFFGQLHPDLAVKNSGIHGYGMSQSLVTLDERIHEPGALVVAQTTPWHAHRAACIPSWTRGAPRFVLDDRGKLIRSGACEPVLWKAENVPVLKHSRLYRNWVLPALERGLSSRTEWLDLYLAILRDMKRITDARSQRLLLGFIRASEAGAAQLGRSNEQILEAIKAMGIDVVDLTLAPTFESQSAELYLHPEDRHPTAAANRRRAEILSDHLYSLARH